MPQSSFASLARHWHLLGGLIILVTALFAPSSAAYAANTNKGYCLGDGCVDDDPLGIVARFSKEQHGDAGGEQLRGSGGSTDAWPFGEIIYWDEMGDDGAPVELPGCDCYFSSDCNGGSSCNYQVLSEEDNCAYMENKPNGNPGTGCDLVHLGPFMLGICDGACTLSRDGSSFGHEDGGLLQQGIRLWGDAFLDPALNGGGYPDEQFVGEALALPYNQLGHASLIGRYAATTLAMAAGLEYQEYYCHYEANDPNLDDYFVDLSDDNCLAAAAQLSIDTLLAEMNQPGSGKAVISELHLLCPQNDLAFPVACGNAPDPISCGYARIQDTAAFLTTPVARALDNVTWISTP